MARAPRCWPSWRRRERAGTCARGRRRLIAPSCTRRRRKRSSTLLSGAGVIAEVDGDGRLREDLDPALVQWEFHDLLFHSRSRLGRHEYAFGGVFPFLGQIPPLPAVKPSISSEIVPLHKPDLALLEQRDPSLSSVLESRASVREYDTVPISDREVGEFLYRTARVRHIREPDASRGWHSRPAAGPIQAAAPPTTSSCT